MLPIHWNKTLYHLYIRLVALPFKIKPHDGIAVMEQEWDNLLVLDACRYDTFQKLNTIPGDLQNVKSRATSTPQWLKRNFTDTYDNVVYVAGNPYVSDLANDGYFNAEDHFHHVEHVWDTGWDDDLHTVPPEAINEAARRMQEKYPDRRLILHYMQPHEPFIGDTNFLHIEERGWDRVKQVWFHPDLKQAYDDNLRLVLDAVDDLLPHLEGKIVITADHGELFGTYGLIRHPKDVFLKTLYEVPWLVIED